MQLNITENISPRDVRGTRNWNHITPERVYEYWDLKQERNIDIMIHGFAQPLKSYSKCCTEGFKGGHAIETYILPRP